MDTVDLIEWNLGEAENAAALSAARYTADEMFSRIRTNQTSTGRKPL